MTVVTYSLFFRLVTYDFLTAQHSVCVANMAYFLCQELKLPPEECECIYTAALLHDIGKMQIPLDILRAPRALTDEEKQIINTHPSLGAEMAEEYGVPTKICEYIRWHHERIDGTGYPDGLFEDKIPLGAKIIAVCDTLHALLQKRPYKESLTKQECKNRLVKGAGALDWDVVTVALLFWKDLLKSATDDFKKFDLSM